MIEEGHWHDVCSAVHPMALASPFFKAFELPRRIGAGPARDPVWFAAGRWRARHSRTVPWTVRPTSWAVTAAPTAGLWLRWSGTWTASSRPHRTSCCGFRPTRCPPRSSASGRSNRDRRSGISGSGGTWHRPLLSGVAAHAVGRLPSLAAAGAGLLLTALAHGDGWPIPVGGSSAIAAAMVKDIEAHGGTIQPGFTVTSLAELEPAKAVLLDVAPPALARIAGSRLPSSYRRSLESYRFGSGRLQGGLHPFRPGALGGPGPRRRRHRPRRRHAGRNSAGRTRGCGGPASRAAVCPGVSALVC